MSMMGEFANTEYECDTNGKHRVDGKHSQVLRSSDDVDEVESIHDSFAFGIPKLTFSIVRCESCERQAWISRTRIRHRQWRCEEEEVAEASNSRYSYQLLRTKRRVPGRRFFFFGIESKWPMRRMGIRIKNECVPCERINKIINNIRMIRHCLCE